MIVWNTIEAPYVWDVTGTEFTDSSINLSNSERSLLSIYFRDYADKKGELKELKEVEIKKANIDDRQLKLALTEKTVKDFDFQTTPRKDKDEKSYKTDDTNVLVYVPEDVVAELDELEDKVVTLILGEDNVAVAVIVEEENTEKDFLTAYTVGTGNKKKIVVGGEKYDLAKDYKDKDGQDQNGYTVELNGQPVNADADKEPIVEALKLALNDKNLVDTKDIDDIEKKIQAELTIEDDKVVSIELVTSRTIKNYSFEALVLEVKETRTAYKIVTNKGNIYWDLEAEEEDEIKFPKVYVDGERSDIRNIVAGNVITVMGTDSAFEIADDTCEDYKIYVSTKTIETTGEDIDVKKKNKAIKVDGTSYLPTAAEYAGTTDKELEDIAPDSLKTGEALLGITECDDVVIHLNMFGEYYAVLTTEAVSSYTFGVITWLDSNVTVSGDENEIQESRIRVLLSDGTKAYYTISVDTSDEDLEDVDVMKHIIKPLNKGDFVMFEANADKVITAENATPVRVLTAGSEGKDLPGDYVVKALKNATAVSKDDEEFVLGTTDYEYDATETVIFSNHAHDINNDQKIDYNLEVVDKWSAIVKDNDFLAKDTAFMVLADKDDEIPAYIVVEVPEEGYSSSDATYATVYRSIYKKGEDKYVQFVEGEAIEVKNENAINTLTDADSVFVEYAMGSSKVSKAARLLDVVEFEDLGLEDAVPVNVINSGYETLAVTNSAELNYVAAACADDANVWGSGKDLSKYATVILKDFLPTEGEFTLETYSEAFKDVYTTGNLANGIMTTTKANLDPDDETRFDLGVLVKADGEAHEIKFTWTIDGEKTEETLYVTATINDSLEADVVTGNVNAVAKENFEVKKDLEEKSKYIKLTYVDDEDEIVNPLGSVKVDKDALVYDLTSGELVEASLADITKGDLVIAYRNADCDEDAEANVLVIVK